MAQMRFLVGLDQLSLGSRTKCDLLNTEGEVAIPLDTAISPALLNDLKSRSIKGLFVDRDDFLDVDRQLRGLDLMATSRRIEDIRGTIEINKPISEATHREALALARETLTEAGFGHPIDYGAIEDLARRIQSDIRGHQLLMVNHPAGYDPADYLYRHSVNVMVNMLALAGKTSTQDEEARRLATGAFLHDVGKVQVSSTIVTKPGKLTDEEFAQMRDHPFLGLKIAMRGLDITDETCRVILHHHERYDGKGYPLKLGRETISRAGRMMAIIDAFDAMTNDRIYARKITGHQALNRIITDAGSQFDPLLTHEFLSLSGAYPDGCVIELNTGEIGVVRSQNTGNIVSPNVEIHFNPWRRVLPEPRAVNLSRDSSRFIKGEFHTC